MRDVIARFSKRLLSQRHHILHKVVQLSLRELTLPRTHGRPGFAVFSPLPQVGLGFFFTFRTRKVGGRRFEGFSCQSVSLALRPVTDEAMLLIECLSLCSIAG